jgi:hypothetical protein
VKEEQRQAKLEKEVEDTLVKAIQKAKVGSPEQRDLIAQWKRIGAATWGDNAGTPCANPCVKEMPNDNET